MMRRLFISCITLSCLLQLGCQSTPARNENSAQSGKTRIALVNGQWRIDDVVTYPGAPAEGLLMNIRMVNSTFEDRNDKTRPAGFDAEANTDAFLTVLPEYLNHGVRAFTLCLQGGMPGYEGAVNSAFEPDGSLRPEYLARVKRVIQACDELGCAVILGCYYQRQEQILKDEEAVKRGVVNVVRWIESEGFSNVMLEIANEYPHDGFDHDILRNPKGEAELIRLAKKTSPSLLVSTSGIGDGRFDSETAEAADFILIHYNGVPVEKISERIQDQKKYGKAIVCNEDDKVGEPAARAAELSVENGASWGYMNSKINQYFPLEFKGRADDPVMYDRLKELTTKVEMK